MGPRRAARSRDLLHPQRLPDHRHPALAARPPRPHPPRPLLARARPAPAAGAVRDAYHRRRLGDDLRPRAAAAVPQRGGRLGALRKQLTTDIRRLLLLSPLRSAGLPQPLLVTGDRGAVIHRLALRTADRLPPRP